MKIRRAFLEIDSPQGPKTYDLNVDRVNSFDELYVDFHLTLEYGGERYTVFLHPKQDLVVKRLDIQFELVAQPDTRFFANGYQSWSESRLLPVQVDIPRLRRLAKPFMGHYGDEYIGGIPRKKGCLHSWTYTYLTDHSDQVRFWGSTNESTGFTLFLYDQPNGIFTARKDLENLALTHSFPALEFWTGQGSETSMFDAWFTAVGRIFNSPNTSDFNSPNTSDFNSPNTSDFNSPNTGDFNLPNTGDFNLPNTGDFNSPDTSDFNSPNTSERIKNSLHNNNTLNWTSWYRYFNQITEAIIENNLESVAASGLPFRYFQIDDGWQTAVGDWRSTKPEFPGGMGQLARKIREKGLEPGLWLAPFVASATSQLAKRNPEWLLKGPGGRPLRVGWNPLWGGWYYALNFYHPGVQDYLSGVFHIVLEQWGYALVKLDFLFAACLIPPKGKTRGQVMHDAMEFLRRQVGNRKMLACGVPLGAALGVADFCRIGGDVHLRWEHRALAFLRHRERVSTLASLRATLGRWQLNGRGFLTDPDVFILREHRQHLSPDQQNTLLTINVLLGGVLFTSDDVHAYTPEQRAELDDLLAWHGSRVISVNELEKEVYQIDFEQDGRAYSAFCNLTQRRVQTGRIELLPYETIVL